ncbi:MAG: RNA polymerase sigma factor [Acidimicrobiia bacterium]
MPLDQFGVVYAAHHVRLVRLVGLLGIPTSEAADLVADVFARVFPKWTAGQIDNVGGYLTTAVTNAVRDRQRVRGVAFEPLSDDLVGVADEIPDIGGLERLRWALEQIGHLGREVVVLRFFDELSEQQTSEVLGVPVGTVKSRQSRALMALRGLMNGEIDA